MSEAVKQIMRKYLIREFDELNVLRAPEFKQSSKEDIKEKAKEYIEESYKDGHDGVFFMLGFAVLAIIGEKAKASVYHQTDGKSFADRIDDLGEDFELYELERIVLTEGHRAYVDGQSDAADRIEQKEGVLLFKRWNATMDGRTRKTHRLLNGQIKRRDEMFTTVNGSAKEPGKFGIASEDVNCRCILTFVSY